MRPVTPSVVEDHCHVDCMVSPKSKGVAEGGEGGAAGVAAGGATDEFGERLDLNAAGAAVASAGGRRLVLVVGLGQVYHNGNLLAQDDTVELKHNDRVMMGQGELEWRKGFARPPMTINTDGTRLLQ